MSKPNIAIIVAAGGGSRLGGAVPKQYLPLAGKAVIEHSIASLQNYCEQIIVAVDKSHAQYYSDLDVITVQGGATRQQSVLYALNAVEASFAGNVLIHDAARPFLSKQLLESLITALENSDNAVPFIAPSETTVLQDKLIDRSQVRLVQTPQCFAYASILAVHKQAYSDGKNFTDDASLFAHYLGQPVNWVAGEKTNFKITTKEDMQLAQNIAQNIVSQTTRIGSGYDVHKFSQEAGTYKIMLGGVEVPHSHELIGHSDADVALHAIVDSLLGAIGQGDIGQHFPPSDDKWKGAASSVFIKHALDLVTKAGGKINNIDVTIICEAPKISAYRDKIKAKVAQLLQLDLAQVNIKATTTEKLGSLGRKEGIAAQAVASILI